MPELARSLAPHVQSQSIEADIRFALSTVWSDPTVRVANAVPFGDGHSGFTYLLDLWSRDENGRFVARLSPPGARIAGPADLGRQGRIMSALNRAGLAVPRVLAADSTGLAGGRALLVMARVDGSPWEATASEFGDRLVAARAVEFLHSLRSVPAEFTGLGDEQPATPSSDVERWAGLLPRCPEWLRQPAGDLRHDLLLNVPPGIGASLVHGDYHYGNLLFRGRQLGGVLDWEIADLGDPRLDFGCLAVASMRSRYAHESNPTGSVKISAGELCDLYGIAEPAASWFVAAGCLKYAAILGYNLDLHRRGKRLDPVYEGLVDTMMNLALDGREVLRHGLSAIS